MADASFRKKRALSISIAILAWLGFGCAMWAALSPTDTHDSTLFGFSSGFLLAAAVTIFLLARHIRREQHAETESVSQPPA